MFPLHIYKQFGKYNSFNKCVLFLMLIRLFFGLLLNIFNPAVTMKNHFLLLCILLLILCDNEGVIVEPFQVELSSFSLLSEFNASLSEDVVFTFDGVDT